MEGVTVDLKLTNYAQEAETALTWGADPPAAGVREPEVTYYSATGGSGDLASVMLQPGEVLAEPAEGLPITAAGYADGLFHIQLCRGDASRTDNHAFLWMEDADGREFHCTGISYFTGETAGRPDGLYGLSLCCPAGGAGRMHPPRQLLYRRHPDGGPLASDFSPGEYRLILSARPVNVGRAFFSCHFQESCYDRVRKHGRFTLCWICWNFCGMKASAPTSRGDRKISGRLSGGGRDPAAPGPRSPVSLLWKGHLGGGHHRHPLRREPVAGRPQGHWQECAGGKPGHRVRPPQLERVLLHQHRRRHPAGHGHL